MHDVFISYASVEHARATELKDALDRTGRTVWIDDDRPATGDPSNTGIPPGQQPRDAIARAMAEAATVAVLFSRAWSAGPGCQEELALALKLGKQIVALTTSAEEMPDVPGWAFVAATDDRPGPVLEALERSAPLARAHARATTDGIYGQQRSAWAQVTTHSVIREVELLQSSNLEASGLSWTEELRRFCGQEQTSARRRRVNLSVLSAVALGVVALLTVLALLDTFAAGADRDRSEAAAARARSLLQARQALDTDVTARALELARAAVASESNPSTRSALSLVEQKARYETTVRVAPLRARATAVSDDGRTVLIAWEASLRFVDMAAATSTDIEAGVQVGERAALAPDGSEAYIVSTTGELLCATAGSVRRTGTTGVVDLKYRNGALWWLDGDGRLFRSNGCPDAPPTAVATVEPGRAFELGTDAQRVFVVEPRGVVATYDIDPVAAAGSPAQQVRSVDLRSVPGTADYATTAIPDGRRAPYAERCGAIVHILFGATGRTTLPGAMHVAFAEDGTPVSPRTVQSLMRGPGCGPDDGAWSAAALTDRAQVLPADASYPVGAIDERDQAWPVALANSSDRSVVLVVHEDGRVAILRRDLASWGRAVPDAVIAVPIDGGTVLVDAAGTVRWRQLDGADDLVVGSVGGPPAPTTAATRDRAYVASGARLSEVSSTGVENSADLPGPAQTVTTSPAGDEIVVGGDGWFRRFDLPGLAAPRDLSLPPLQAQERVLTVEPDRDRLLMLTNYSRILLTDRDGSVRHAFGSGVVGTTAARFMPDHSITVLSGDGILRSLDETLAVRRQSYIGSGGLVIEPSRDGSTVIVGTSDFSLWAIDPMTLEPTQLVATQSPDLRLAHLAPDGSFVERVLPGTAQRAPQLERIWLRT